MPTNNYLDVLSNNSIPSTTVFCSQPGSYVGSPNTNNQFIISGEGAYQLTSVPNKINVFVFKPLANTAIFFGFQPELDRINLSKFPGIKSLKDISYTTNPFIIYLSNEQILIFSSNTQSLEIQGMTADMLDHSASMSLTSSTSSFSSSSSYSSAFPLTASNFIFSTPAKRNATNNRLQAAIIIGVVVVFTAVLCAGKIATKAAEEEEAERLRRKDDSSSTSSDTLDYIYFSDDDNDDETARFGLDCTDLRLLLNDDDTYRILDEQQCSEDSDFLLSGIEEEEEVDEGGNDDGNSIGSLATTGEGEGADDFFWLLYYPLRAPAFPLPLPNEEGSIDDILPWYPPDVDQMANYPNLFDYSNSWDFYSPTIYSSPFINNYSTFFGNHDHFDHDSNEDEEDLATGFLDPNDSFPLAMELESLDNNASFLSDYFNNHCNDEDDGDDYKIQQEPTDDNSDEIPSDRGEREYSL
jgi:hypothetical protein